MGECSIGFDDCSGDLRVSQNEGFLFEGSWSKDHTILGSMFSISGISHKRGLADAELGLGPSWPVQVESPLAARDADSAPLLWGSRVLITYLVAALPNQAEGP